MQVLDVYLIKPTHYDDNGYPIQWWRSFVPSNSLACVAALVVDAEARKALGPETQIVCHAIDEVNSEVSTETILKRHRQPGARVLVMLIGVQTNQFPRAIDIARPLRAAGVPVCIGGFHVSGCIAMLGPDAGELDAARDLGLSLFAGEAEEGRIDAVLRDGMAGALQPLYNHLADLPALGGTPTPFLGPEILNGVVDRMSSFDLGRGCPFECSFCTIINVQGRKSRFRTADDLEKIVRENHAHGIVQFFVTDDNLARNRNWEAYADRLIQLRDVDKIQIKLIIQIDTGTHRIPRFIEKMVAAGVNSIFIGLENINPDNLEAANKPQNRIEEYREMFLAWKQHGVIVTCGYIIGFPDDTLQSVLHDIDLIKEQLPVDMLYLNFLTPLPGSEDHRREKGKGSWMDPDFNKYDLSHRVSRHSKMTDAEWDQAFRLAHKSFYSFEHMERIFDRRMQYPVRQPNATLYSFIMYREGPGLERVGSSEFGLARIVRRRQRRHGLPLENPVWFHLRQSAIAAWKMAAYATTYTRLRLARRRARLRYEAGERYMDAAITPVASRAEDQLVIETAARTTAVSRKRMEIRMKVREGAATL
jgi:uncharacterized radical SAM superfamily protein